MVTGLCGVPVVQLADLAATDLRPTRGGNHSKRKRGATAHTLFIISLKRPDMTEILLKGRKIANLPSEQH